ncbi:MAG TPA: hypothetical protein VGD91_28165 [Trebonia sp.]
MDVTVVTPHPFRVLASVPDNMVSLSPDGDWAAWSGVDCTPDGSRQAVVLVSIAVTAFKPGPGVSAGEFLTAALRARHPAGAGVVDQLTTAGGHPAVRVSGAVTQQVNGRAVTTGQSQVLVVFQGAGALGVVSGLCPDPADLGRAAELVAVIAAGMTVAATSAAA